MLCPSCAAENQPEVEVCFSCGRHLTALTQGSVIASRYEIVSLLGKGGMGIVYKANDRLLEEEVAIKVLRTEFASTPDMAQRFRSEIKLARKVSHPNVCRIHEYGVDGSVSYISMALIEGTDLRKLLLQHPEGMPREEALRLAIQVADGLQAIHDVGVIHRDLKTPNIFIDPNGLVQLMDFGIAKESGRSGGLTATGDVMGTPEYMSPEQCRGDKLDFRSDVYSLAIVVFELFTGHVPFRGETLMATLLKQMQDPPPLDGPVAARIPPGVVRLLRKALAKDPAQRFGSAAEVAEALREARKEPAGATSVEDPPPTRSLRAPQEQRKHSRLDISVDVLLKKTSAGGSVLQEERTVADNIGRGGARVLTAMTGLSVGDGVVLQEVGGDFHAKAAVRHVHGSPETVQRLGLEFLDRPAPDRLVPTDSDSKPGLTRPPLPHPHSSPRPAASSPGLPAQPPTAPSTASTPTTGASPGAERRRESRLEISVNLILKRIGPSGEVLQEERTVADDIGLRGARVLTAMTGLQVGEVLSMEEVGSDFRTRAIIRSSYVGKDNIQRLGMEFLDRSAPDHLVASARSKPRTPTAAVPRAPSHPVPSTTPPPPLHSGREGSERLLERRREIVENHEALKSRNYFEVLAVSRVANANHLREAYARLTKRFQFNADTESGLLDLRREAEAIVHRAGEAYDVLTDPARRSAYEATLGSGRKTPRTMAAAPEQPPPPPSPPVDLQELEAEILQVDHFVHQARQLLAEDKTWDALKILESARNLAKGTKTNRALLVLLARTTAKNPKWHKNAEGILVSVIHEDPANVDAHLVLGTLYRAAGMKGRAAAEFQRVLQLDPKHRQAAAELRSL